MANKCGNEVEQAGLRMEGGERDVMKEEIPNVMSFSFLPYHMQIHQTASFPLSTILS